MRIPYVIGKSTLQAYVPSEVCLKHLIGELARNVHPEDLEWDSSFCPSLVTLCIKTLANDFQNKNYFLDVNGADKDNLLEFLPTNLPLELTIPLIHVEDYWRRCYEDKFGGRPLLKNISWKVSYIERYIAEVIEQMQPQYADEEEVEPLTTLFSDYVTVLTIKQLKVWMPPLTMSAEDLPDVYPADHVSFVPIFKHLQNIVKLDIMYTMRDLGEDFDWHRLGVSVDDCKRLGQAILLLKSFKILKLHHSKISDSHVQALMQQLCKNTTIEELDLSNCEIKDRGALCIAKLMTVHTTLTKLILCNNQIGGTGGIGIGFALTQESCCPLETLDLRLNPLGHEGTMGILRAVVRKNTVNIKELSLAGCLFEDDTGLRVAQMIGMNSSIERLNVSNNWFDHTACDKLLECMPQNKTLRWVDLRDTDIPNDVKDRVGKYLLRNAGKLDEIESSDISNIAVTEESVDEELKELIAANAMDEDNPPVDYEDRD